MRIVAIKARKKCNKDVVVVVGRVSLGHGLVRL